MDRARWRRIDEVFAAALEQPVERRAELLDRTCGDDAELRSEVESLPRQRGAATSQVVLLRVLTASQRGASRVASGRGRRRLRAQGCGRQSCPGPDAVGLLVGW
jgi:hypothetical protein